MIYIPEKFVVGFQRRVNHANFKTSVDNDNEYILGFASYYDNKGKLKKEGSFNSWRQEENPILTFDNTPTNGFKLLGHESKYSSWSGTGRSIFSVEDPRGFVLQINSGNLIEIIRQCDVKYGKIENKCVWSWSGADLILAPEGTDIYNEGIESFRIKNQSTSIKDISLGDSVLLKNGNKGIWYGAQYVTEHKPYYGSYRTKNLEININTQSRKFLFLEDGIDKPYIYIKPSFEVSEIIKKTGSPLTPEQVSIMFNEQVKTIGSQLEKKYKLEPNKYPDIETKWNGMYSFEEKLLFSPNKIKDNNDLLKKVTELKSSDWAISFYSTDEDERRHQKYIEEQRMRKW